MSTETDKKTSADKVSVKIPKKLHTKLKVEAAKTGKTLEETVKEKLEKGS